MGSALSPRTRPLFRVCSPGRAEGNSAFLSPDAIPEELFSEGSTVLGTVLEQTTADALALNGAIEKLRKFSLVQRDPEARLLRLHRLVQVVIQDALPAEDRCRWAERAVRATSLMFARSPGVSDWSQDQRFLPQAQACSVLIQEYAFEFAEAAALLQWIAGYLYIATLYEQVEPLYQRALRIWEKMLGPEHPQTAYALSGLATLFRGQKKFEQAESLYRQALHIREQAYGPEHPDVAAILNGLANLSSKQEMNRPVELLYRRALAIREHALGEHHLETAETLHDFAVFQQHSLSWRFAVIPIGTERRDHFLKNLFTRRANHKNAPISPCGPYGS